MSKNNQGIGKMAFTTMAEIKNWLNEFTHSQLCEGWADIPNLVSLTANGTVTVTLPFVSISLKQELLAWAEQQKQSLQLDSLSFDVVTKPATLKTDKPAVKGVKNIIAVSSGKGGVGKSTTAVNLALALHHLGARVGILDADIYGPSVPLMLGVEDKKPNIVDNNRMMPVEAHGIYSNSIGYLVDKAEAAVWRGPMASKALSQLLNETWWPELDYLVIDMPPGTGDIQLTLSQQIPTTGAVIVTTPQDLALTDAIKGVNMFTKVDVPVIGIVENMSVHICSQCGYEEAIFGTGGAELMAKKYSIPLLGKLPLHIDIRSETDSGTPSVAENLASAHSQLYIQLAEQVSSRLYWQGEVIADQIMFKSL